MASGAYYQPQPDEGWSCGERPVTSRLLCPGLQARKLAQTVCSGRQGLGWCNSSRRHLGRHDGAIQFKAHPRKSVGLVRSWGQLLNHPQGPHSWRRQLASVSLAASAPPYTRSSPNLHRKSFSWTFTAASGRLFSFGTFMRRGIGRLRAGGSFNPIPALFAAGEQGWYYDPSDFSTMFQDSAGTTPVTAVTQPVGKILDKSGRGNHLTQATTTSRPTVQQDASGYYYLNFDGVDDSLQTAAAIDLTSYTKGCLWLGFNKTSDAAVAILTEFGVNGNNAGCFYVSAPETAAGVNIGTRNGSAGYTPAPFSAGSGIVLSQAMDTLGGTTAAAIQNRINGIGNTTGTTGLTPVGAAFGNQILYIGRRTGATLPYSGRLYSWVGRFSAAASTAAQIASAETYVGSKMGIPL